MRGALAAFTTALLMFSSVAAGENRPPIHLANTDSPSNEERTQPVPSAPIDDLIADLRSEDSNTFFKAFYDLHGVLSQNNERSVHAAGAILASSGVLADFSEVTSYLKKIKQSGKPVVAAQFLLNFLRAKRTVLDFQFGRVALGQVVVADQKMSPTMVFMQVPILEDGYFASEVLDLDKPLSFRAYGYKGVDVALNKDAKANKNIVDVSRVEMQPISSTEQASLKAHLKVDPDSMKDASVLLFLQPGPVNSPTRGIIPRNKWPDPISIRPNNVGKCVVDGLSAGNYYLLIQRKGHSDLSKRFSIASGQTLDLGDVKP